MSWFLWGILLLLQNAAFTWVSRARNSSNLKYHAMAAVASNGVWFASQFFVIDIMMQLKVKPTIGLAMFSALFYVSLTVFSSVYMHKLLMRYIEHGNRKVGA